MSASKACVKRRRVETGNPSKDSASEEEEGGGSSTSRGSARKSAKQRRSQCLSSFQVSTIVVSKQIILALASAQKAEGKTDLAEFIVNRRTKVVEEVIATEWEMEEASEV